MSEHSIMFVCKANSCRSQMAEGWARTLANDTVTVTSSGLASTFVNPTALQAMQEAGVDISKQSSKKLSDFDPSSYDVVVSLCGCGANLPLEWTKAAVFEDWNVDDPADQPYEVFQRVRDEIRQRVETLLSSLRAA